MVAVVVIPIYKSELNPNEIISLKQCFKILGKHPIIFVAPEKLDVSHYEKILGQKVKTERFDDFYFENISGYNHLMLSMAFYQRFLNYEYMLIYQLDCYVFRDELVDWCNQDYDYIGAPWLDNSFYIKSRIEKFKFLIKQFFQIKNKDLRNKNILTYQVGNGGFSLRKISSFIKVLKYTDERMLKRFKMNDDSKSIHNEDVFWSFVADGIKKPNYKIASKFALDLGADIGIRLNNANLPFGCHAWGKKYDYWKQYIKINENSLNERI